MARMRRVTLLVSLMVTFDLALWAAILPLLPELSDRYHLSKLEAGLLVASYSFGVILLAVPVGHLSDRVGSRRMSIAGQLVMAAATAGFALAPGFGGLLAARVLQGLASAITWSAALAWLAESAPAGRRGRVIGTANSAATFGIIAGPLLGGVLASAVGIRTTFLAASVAVLCLALAGLFVPAGSQHLGREQSFMPAVRAIARERLIAISLLVILLVAMVGGTVQLLISLRLGDDGYGQATIGILFAAGATLGAIAIVVTGRIGDRVGRPRVAFWDCLALAAATSVLSLPLAAGMVAAMVIVVAPLQATLYGVGYPLGADGADSAGVGHGLVLGLVNLAWGLGSVVGPPIGGGLAQVAGERPAFLTMTVACLVSAAVIRGTVMGKRATPALDSGAP